MIIVWASIEMTPEQTDTVLSLSIEHMQRSRREPGCISYDVHIDARNPNRLVFFEEWESRGALKRHFDVPDSVAFFRYVSRLVDVPPRMRIFEATDLDRAEIMRASVIRPGTGGS